MFPDSFQQASGKPNTKQYLSPELVTTGRQRSTMKIQWVMIQRQQQRRGLMGRGERQQTSTRNLNLASRGGDPRGRPERGDGTARTKSPKPRYNEGVVIIPGRNLGNEGCSVLMRLYSGFGLMFRI